MTLSIAARCPRTGHFGVGALTAMLGVGKLVTHAKPGVGAVATQAFMNPYLGFDGLREMESGASAEDALDALLRADPDREKRQVGAVDRQACAHAFTGSDVQSWGGHLTGDGFAVQGNRLVGPDAVDATAQAFKATDDDLAERLLLALEAGEATGADTDGTRSATIYVMGHEEYPLWDLRVDRAGKALAELRRMLEHFREELLPVVERLPTRANPRGGFTQDPGI